MLRLVTFNAQHGRTAAGRVDNELLGETCAAFAADVLAVQELDWRVGRSGFVDQTAVIACAAGLTPVFAAARRKGLFGRYGHALFGRGAVRDVETIALPRTDAYEPRVAVIAIVETRAGPLAVAATHLSYHGSETLRQLDRCIEALSNRPAPRVLLGDLNAEPDRIAPRLAVAGLTLLAPGPTFPSDAPARAIDHIAVAGLAVDQVAVLDAAVGDHRPVAMTVDT
jgi:endonuclease/exonuclease/phosphatase family metal-dependent hydrolase